MTQSTRREQKDPRGQHPDIVRIRLDTTKLLDRIERYLRGKRHSYQYNKEKDEVEVVEVADGEPKCNDKGVQAIMSFCEHIINPQTVQGNYKRKHYWDYLHRHRKEFAASLMKNLYEYDIDEDDYDGIIDTVFAAVEPFMSRLVDNKERESYGHMKTETHTEKDTGGFSLA